MRKADRTSPFPMHRIRVVGRSAPSLAAVGTPPAVEPWQLGCLFAAAAGLLARAGMLETLAPFHLAWAAAVAVRAPTLFLWTVPPALLVRALLAGPSEVAGEGLALALMFVYLRLRHSRRVVKPVAEGAEEGRLLLEGGLLAGGSVLVGSGLATLVWEFNLFGGVALAFRVVLTSLLALLFLRALNPLGRLLGEGIASLPVEDPTARDEWLAVAVLVASIIAGLYGLHFGPLPLALIVAGFFVMTAAQWGGPGAGAAAGAAVAGIAVISGTAHPISLAVQALSGFLAGGLALLASWGAAVGYAAGFFLLSAFYPSGEDLVEAMWGVLPAAALFLGLRLPMFQGARERIAWKEGLVGRREGLPRARADLYEVESGPSLSRSRRTGFLFHDGRDGRRNTGVTTDRRPPLGTEQLEKYAGVARELARAFDQAAPDEEKFKQRTVSQLIHGLAQQVCPGCPHHTVCWDEEFFKTYQGLSNVLAHRERLGRVDEKALPPALQQRCPRQKQLAGAVNNAYDLFEINYQWWRRYDATRRTVADQLRAIGEVFERIGAAARKTTEEEEERAGVPVTLPYRIGVARVPKNAKVVSGDSYVHRLVGDRRLALVLSDGMGAGTKAARESRTIVSLLERFLELGFDETSAVRTVNQLLLLRATDEMFATLDLALVDLGSGDARFLKIGAAPTFWRRGSRVGVIRAQTLPMGVLSEPDVQVTRRSLRRGDLIVMLTDGVIQTWENVIAGEDWVKGFLASLDRDEPRHVAGALLNEALRRSPQGVRDDMTVLALKIL